MKKENLTRKKSQQEKSWRRNTSDSYTFDVKLGITQHWTH